LSDKKLSGYAVLFGLIGFSIIIYKLGWLVSLGIYLVLWGNKIETRTNLNNTIRRILLK